MGKRTASRRVATPTTATESADLLVKRSRNRRSGLSKWWRETIILSVVALVGISVGLGSWWYSTPNGQLGRSPIIVRGNIGARPVLQLDRVLPVMFAKSYVDLVGSGPKVTQDRPVLLSLSVFSGNTGKLLGDGKVPKLISGVVSSQSLGDQMYQAIIDKTEGSRIIIKRPVTVAQTYQTEIAVLDILATSAQGKSVDLPANLGYQVKSVTDIAPSISAFDPVQPRTTHVTALIEGTGRQVKANEAIVIQQIRWNWGNSQATYSTWGIKPPEEIVISKAFPALKQALPDQRVGSRLAVVIPPDQGDGAATQVAIIDILAVSNH